MGNFCGSQSLPKEKAYEAEGEYQTTQDTVSSELSRLPKSIPPTIEALLLADGLAPSLTWLNSTIASSWARVDAAVQALIEEDVKPKIDEKLPHFLKGAVTVEAKLGDKAPNFGPIKVFRSANQALDSGPSIHLDFDIDMKLDANVSVGYKGAKWASVGISKLRLKGTVICSLDPLVDRIPIVGAANIYFKDAPDIRVDFTGLTNVLDFPGIRSVVRHAIDSAVASKVVIPNSFTLNVANKDIKGPIATSMLPIGFLVVKVKSCKGLRQDADWLDKIDPYVRLRLGGQIWDVNIKQDGTPIGDSEYSFAVFDSTQMLRIDVFDDDLFTADDHIGRHEPISLATAVGTVNQPIKLSDPRGTGKEAGRLDLEAWWLRAVPMQKSDIGSIIVVKAEHLCLPKNVFSKDNGYRLMSRLRQPDKHHTTWAEKACPSVKADDDKAIRHLEEVEMMLADLAEHFERTGDAGPASKVTGLVSHLPSLVPIFNHVWFKVTDNDLETAVLELTVLDDGNKVLAKKDVPLKEIREGSMKLPGPVLLENEDKTVTIKGDIDVELWGLQP
eukprot:gb/GFBE01063200.1/.p1 GENE.gb/GFBE01063200.1/~~gb/GFBE01063200.1/.p1  ORF type:complete len:557 (+),score=91.59 gb/GFBE01063200.1/:1-1671(+)